MIEQKASKYKSSKWVWAGFWVGFCVAAGLMGAVSFGGASYYALSPYVPITTGVFWVASFAERFLSRPKADLKQNLLTAFWQALTLCLGIGVGYAVVFVVAILLSPPVLT
ncbi:MAG: hypothetical protein QM667_04495 [Asticcacaulis sp.]